MAYRVGLERGAQGGPLAWVLEDPGCFAFGHTEREVLARIPQAVREYLAWLGAHGIPAAGPGVPEGFPVVEIFWGAGWATPRRTSGRTCGQPGAPGRRPCRIGPGGRWGSVWKERSGRPARRCGGRPGTNGIPWPISSCCAAPWGADESGCGRTDGAQRAWD